MVYLGVHACIWVYVCGVCEMCGMCVHVYICGVFMHVWCVTCCVHACLCACMPECVCECVACMCVCTHAMVKEGGREHSCSVAVVAANPCPPPTVFSPASTTRWQDGSVLVPEAEMGLVMIDLAPAT